MPLSFASPCVSGSRWRELQPGFHAGAPSSGGAIGACPNDAANSPEKPASDALAAKSLCYRIDTTISFRNGRRTRSEVVIAMGDKGEPYHVLSWQDDLELRDRPPQRRVSP